jgi:hypothetical protein
MTEPLPPETLARLHQAARIDGAFYAQVLLIILERLELLEAALQQPSLTVPPTPEAAPVATDEELLELAEDSDMDRWEGERSTGGTVIEEGCWEAWDHQLLLFARACYDLGRQHGAAQPPAAQPTPPVAPAGGLVERVGAAMERHYVIGDIHGSWDAQARAAIREVAAWIRSDLNGRSVADRLEREVEG